MQLPKLTPLQSRFAASLAASAILIILYFTLTKPQFAYSVELDSRIPPDHNHPILPHLEMDFDEEEEEATTPGLWIRAPGGITGLANNEPQNMNIQAGETQNWVLPEEVVNGPKGVSGLGLPSDNITGTDQLQESHELRKRQDGSRVYITINTCLQPGSPSSRRDTDESIPPQLELYVSQSTSNQSPGPSISDQKQRKVQASGGYALIEIEATSDVFIGIAAPNTSTFNGIWNYDVAGSIDAPYHRADETWPNLFFVDGDDHAALLITNDTTQTNASSTVYQKWMNMTPPYGMFAHNQDDHSILGVRNSYCGLKHLAQIVADLDGVQNQNVVGMTNRGMTGKPKEQFYITSLNASSAYYGFLAMDGNSTASGSGVVGGGGKVWSAINFTTKANSNCALMYNLSFCSEVAYAVPSNPNIFSPATGLPALAALYDHNAASLYQYFNYSLQQIPCDTTSTAQYSLARTCDDCARAYKQWLCAVTIPRCEDYSNTAPWLKPRNVAQQFTNGSMISPQLDGEQALLASVASNSSRNPIIDHDIRPGPYKEVLPCDDLCYDLVQSCPAALGFGCPLQGKGLWDSYGNRSGYPGNITCSYLGAAYYLSGAGRLDVGLRWAIIGTLAFALWVV